MAAIFKKELKGYLTSMIGYVFIFFILILEGIYFTAYNIQQAYPVFGATLNSITFVFTILVPVLTMKVIAEDRKQKTDQLLLTAPVSVPQIVIGKYLALCVVYLIPIVVISFYPLIMSKYGTVSFAMSYTSILGFTMLGLAQIAVGVFISSITENPVIAAVICFIALFLAYMSEGIGSLFSESSFTSFGIYALLIAVLAIVIFYMIRNLWIAAGIGIIGEAVLICLYIAKSTLFEGSIQKVLNLFNFPSRLDNFTSGILDLQGIVYFLSVIVIFLYLTIQSITKRRWN